MNDAPSLNTRAILLLTAPLSIGRKGQSSPKRLAAGEYNRLARRLRELRRQPADLLGDGSRTLLEECRLDLDPERLGRLLDRGFLLSQAMERWRARALWVTSRADAQYPRRLKARLREQAPPVLYGCGDRTDLDSGGLAVVGSRNVDDDLLDYTEGVGRLAAEARRTLVSGGARGIDQAAMRGALDAGGTVTCVLADGLERAATRREHRDALMDGRLVLLCPYDPAAGFLVGHAMQRNKLIYALSDAALVVNHASHIDFAAARDCGNTKHGYAHGGRSASVLRSSRSRDWHMPTTAARRYLCVRALSGRIPSGGFAAISASDVSRISRPCSPSGVCGKILRWISIASSRDWILKVTRRVLMSLWSVSRAASSFMASRCCGDAPVTIRLGVLNTVRAWLSGACGMKSVAFSFSQFSGRS